MKEITDLGINKRQLARILNIPKVKPSIIKSNISDNVFEFGVVSDTHFGSKLAKIDELHTFYEICEKKNIKTVFHAGDLIDGWGIWNGQENETIVFGVKNQVQFVVDNYPKMKGGKTYFITGNHCLSWWNKSGIDVGTLISKERSDMVYVGQYGGDVVFNDVIIRLHHGEAGGAYALSYKPQRIVEQIPSGQKPHIMIFGHWHVCFYFFYRLIHIIQAGCFQGQSTYLLRKGINPTIGGWTVKVRVSKIKKTIISITPTFIPFIKEVQNE